MTRLDLRLLREPDPGQTSDYLGFKRVMAGNLSPPSVLLADRGHDADSIRVSMEARSVLPVIMRKSRKKRVGVDPSLYSLCNVVERCSTSSRTRDESRPTATRQRKLPKLHRHHFDPLLAPPLVNMT